MHGCQENMAVPRTGEENEVRKESSHRLSFFVECLFVVVAMGGQRVAEQMTPCTKRHEIVLMGTLVKS